MVDTKKPKLRAAIYIRVSTAEQQDMYWPDLQEAKIRAYIDLKSNDIEYAGDDYFYVDAASGADPAETRPWFQKLLHDATYYVWEEKPFDIVIVYKIDRFARKLSVLTAIVDMFKSLEVDFVSTQELIDTSSSFGKAMLWILGIFAELERDMINERTTAGREEALKQGKWYKPIFWYCSSDNDWIVKKVQKHADIVERIFQMFVYEEKSIQQICDTLRTEKVLIPWVQMNSNASVRDVYNWWDNTVRNILKDETYIGKYYYHKKKTITDPITNKKRVIDLPKEEWTLSPIKHISIVSDEIFEKAQLLIVEWAAQRKKSSNYLLTWLLKCDACKEMRDRGMLNRAGYPTDWKRKYQCNGKSTKKYAWAICNTLPMDQDDLDLLVATKLKHLLMHPDSLVQELNWFENLWKYRELLDKKIITYRNLYENRRVALENIDMMIGEWEISFEEWKLRKAKIKQHIKELVEETAILKKNYDATFDADAQVKAFEYLSQFIWEFDAVFSDYERLRYLLNLLIDQIIIYSDENIDYAPPGIKKAGQLFPHTMVIVFKLPQTVMNDLQSKTAELDNKLGKLWTINAKYFQNSDWWNTNQVKDSAIRVNSPIAP